MKMLILAVSLIVASFAALASDPGFNSEAYLAANPDVKAAGYTAYQHINMIGGPELAARLAATSALVNKATSNRDVIIMFCGDCHSTFSEASVIQNAFQWFASSPLEKSTVKDMVQAGWTVQSVFNLNPTQFYVVFVR